jgi:hypothetical protein
MSVAIVWTPKQWSAVQAAIAQLSRRTQVIAKIGSSLVYCTVGSVAAGANVSADTARIALRILVQSGVLVKHGANMYRARISPASPAKTSERPSGLTPELAREARLVAAQRVAKIGGRS